MNIIVKPKDSVNGIFEVPGNKSVSHRAVMLGAIADGVTEIEGFLDSDDCRATIDCFRELGITIETGGDTVKVHGRGMRGLKAPSKRLYVGNSGTTIRLMAGILAAQSFDSEITGDESIQRRDMLRVIKPLSLMGADISSIEKDGFAPLLIRGGRLNGISYSLPVASAQVKSAIILAGIYAAAETTVTEPKPTRDHTEIMLNFMGANVTTHNQTVTVQPVAELQARRITVTGDISSAAYFMVAGLIIPNSKIIITNVGVNITRSGIISALRDMGGSVEVLNRRLLCGEWVADICVTSSALTGTEIGGSIIPRLIDEIPVLAVAAAFADGVTVIKDAQELKVKESNRIKTVADMLRAMGGRVTETDDGMIIEGGRKLTGAKIDAFGDHRIAMSAAVAAMGAEGETEICGAECVGVSFPDFFEYIEKL